MHSNCYGISTIEVFVDYTSPFTLWSVICARGILATPMKFHVFCKIYCVLCYFLSPASLDVLTRMGQLKVCICGNVPQCVYVCIVTCVLSVCVCGLCVCVYKLVRITSVKE